MFEMMDMDKNGNLCFQELKDGLDKIGHPVPDHDVQLLIDAADLDGNGLIDCEDNRSPHNEKIINDIIFDIDLDRDGRISYEEFKAMMTTGVEWRMASRQYSRAMLNALSQRLFKD